MKMDQLIALRARLKTQFPNMRASDALLIQRPRMLAEPSRTWKVITKASRGSRGVPAEFVDWYTGTEKEARECWAEDLHRYGLPADAQGQFIECDPVTLEPLPYPPRETVAELADRFSAIIRAWLKPHQLFLVRAHPINDPCCLTHNFCDSNQAMLYAWEGCFGRGDAPAILCEGFEESDPVVNRHERLINQAWRLAREKGFACAS